MNWFKSLSTFWKIALIVGAIIILIFITDRFTGYWSDIKGYMFDKQYTERMAEVDKLTKENDVLKAQKAELEKQAIESKAKEAIFTEREKALDAQTKAQLDKLDEALAQQDKEDAETAQPIDNYTRCERTKQKMLSLNIPSAKEINCDEYKQ